MLLRCSPLSVLNVHPSQTLYGGTNASDAKRYTDAYAEAIMGGGCPLFARKFLPDSSRAVLALLRDCTNKLSILSSEFCLGA